MIADSYLLIYHNYTDILQMWGFDYSQGSLISLALSILLNAALLLIILVRIDKVTSYRRSVKHFSYENRKNHRRFFYFYVLLDVVFSVAQYIAVPVRIHSLSSQSPEEASRN